MVATVKIGDGAMNIGIDVTFTGDVTVGLRNIGEIEVQENRTMPSLPRYMVSYKAMRCWVSESEGKKLLDAGAKAVG